MDSDIRHSQFVLDHLLEYEVDSHTQIISSGTLIDLIQLHYRLRSQQHQLAQRVKSSCDCKQGQLAKEPVETPAVSAMRHRLAARLNNAGYSCEFTKVPRIPEKFLPELIDQFDRAVDYLQFKLFEVEARLIDEPPINPQEARAKASLLIKLMKEEAEFDPTLFAFSLEECFAMF